MAVEAAASPKLISSFLTDDAKDLVSQMLEADPNRRVTVEDALKHPWIRVSNVNVWFCHVHLH